MIALPISGGILLLSGLVFFLGFNRDQKDRRTILYIIVTLLFAILSGLLVYWFKTKNIMNTEDTYILIQGILLVFGIFHVWWLYRQLFWSKRHEFIQSRDSFLPEALYTLLLASVLTVGILVVLAYTIRGMEEIFWGVGFVFLVPFLLVKTYDFMQQIPLRDYKLKWIFTKKLINENEWNWTNEMWVHFQVKESWDKPGMHRLAKFRILTPRHIPLGEVFRLAIREYNRQAPKIVVQDLGIETENVGRFWWLFSLKFVWLRPHTWFPGFRYLDPGDSSLANALRPGDIVKAQRIPMKQDAVLDSGVAIGQMY